VSYFNSGSIKFSDVMSAMLPSKQLSPDLMARRVERENAAGLTRGANPDFFTKIETTFGIIKMLPLALRTLGLYHMARDEFLDFRIRRFDWHFPNLPSAFDKFSLLHLSDLHADLHPDFAGALAKKLTEVDADICVMTGDFQNNPDDPIDNAVAAMKVVLPSISAPVLGVPGNHDRLVLVDALQNLGIRFLLNKTHTITRADEELVFCGIDDPHYFKTHDLQGVDGCGFRVLLSHSPETYQEAAAGNFSFMLSGHTHAGQIRVPVWGPLVRRANVPRALVWGSWEHRKMMGYTTSGTGSTGCALRLFCPPEIIIHRLIKTNQPTALVNEVRTN